MHMGSNFNILKKNTTYRNILNILFFLNIAEACKISKCKSQTPNCTIYFSLNKPMFSLESVYTIGILKLVHDILGLHHPFKQ